MYGVLFARAKWLTIPTACVLLVLRHHPVLAALALITPVAAGLLGPTAPVGPIEMMFYEQICILAPDQEDAASANSDAIDIRDEDIPF
ncbi:MAG: hypothetical protein KGL75_13195 [Acidobacteriota bacterium]|nr:hypothetical protein [Acidobacteriota bacterium]